MRTQIKNKIVVVNGFTCNIILTTYQNKRIAIELIDSTDGESYTIATVNLPKVQMADNEVAIKNYSENEGVLDALIAVGIVGNPLRYVYTGFVQVPICELLIK